jgi:hypothetical protein
MPSQSAPLALDADAPIHPANHIVGQSIQQAFVAARGRNGGSSIRTRASVKCVSCRCSSG